MECQYNIVGFEVLRLQACWSPAQQKVFLRGMEPQARLPSVAGKQRHNSLRWMCSARLCFHSFSKKL